MDAVRRHAVDRLTVELDRAAGLHEAEDRLDRAALPGAVGAKDGADLAGGHLEGDALDGGHGAVADLEILHPEQVAHASAPRYASMTSAFFRTSAGVPSAIFWPKFRTTIRSEIDITTLMLCSISRMVRPRSFN